MTGVNRLYLILFGDLPVLEHPSRAQRLGHIYPPHSFTRFAKRQAVGTPLLVLHYISVLLIFEMSSVLVLPRAVAIVGVPNPDARALVGAELRPGADPPQMSVPPSLRFYRLSMYGANVPSAW